MQTGFYLNGYLLINTGGAIGLLLSQICFLAYGIYLYRVKGLDRSIFWDLLALNTGGWLCAIGISKVPYFGPVLIIVLCIAGALARKLKGRSLGQQ